MPIFARARESPSMAEEKEFPWIIIAENLEESIKKYEKVCSEWFKDDVEEILKEARDNDEYYQVYPRPSEKIAARARLKMLGEVLFTCSM